MYQQIQVTYSSVYSQVTPQVSGIIYEHRIKIYMLLLYKSLYQHYSGSNSIQCEFIFMHQDIIQNLSVVGNKLNLVLTGNLLMNGFLSIPLCSTEPGK